MLPIPRLCSRLLVAVLFLLLLPGALEAQPVRVGGRVVDQEGIQGASGARIELLPAFEDYAAAVRRLHGEPEAKPLATARSDAEGFFEISAPEAGAYRLRVLAEGCLTFELPLAPLIEDTFLEPVSLVRTEPFEIRAFTREGRPLSGVAIRSFPEWFLSGYSGWREEDRGGVTGAGGRLVLRRAPGERLNLIAISPAFLGQSGIPPEDGRPVVLTPRPALRIEVRNAGGQPEPEALIRWRSQPVGLTGPDGRLEVALPPGDEPLTVESREGHWATISARPAGAGSVLSVRLAPPRTVTGRVMSAATSAPLPKAFVWAGGWPDTLARTAADGGFSLALRTLEEVVTLEAAAADHLRPESRFIPPPSSQPIVLKLEPAVRISGRVVDEGDRPVSGTGLQVTPAPKGSTGRALSRADGSFQFSGLAFKGSYEIQASRQGFVRSSLTVRTPAPGQPTVPVRLILKAGQIAFGRVASEDGEPVAGAEVALVREPQGSSETFRALADVEGRFEIRALEAGRFTLWVLGKGFLPFHRTVQVPVEPKRADLGVITLPAGAWIEGQVTDTRGTPLEAARIWTESGPFPAGGPSAETGPDGRFRVLVRRGTPTELGVRREGYLPLLAPRVEAPNPEVLHLELKAARSLSGRVVGPGGEPVANATLMRVAEIRYANSRSGSISSIASLLGSTDAQGGFRVSDLEPGATIDVLVSAEGYTTQAVRGIPIPQDQDLEGLEIVLSRWNVLRIRVLSPEGSPVARALLSAVPEPARQITDAAEGMRSAGSCMTDEQGTCQAEIPEPGPYRVSAVVGQRKSAAVLVQAGPGTTPVELRVPKAHQVSGRVTNRQGRGLAGVTVRLTDDQRSSQEALTEEDGAFALQDVADGSYGLAAKRRGFLQSEGPRELQVEGADVPGLEIQLTEGEGGATLTGRLLGLTPHEVENAKVRVVSMEGLPEEVDAGADGRYRISNLSPGDWSVFAHVRATDRWLQAVARIEAGASEAVLDFDFGKGFTLSGRVLVDGDPVDDAEVSVTDPHESRSTHTAYDGRFQIRNLSPGPSFLMVLASGGTLGQDQSLEIDGDRELTLDIRTGILRGQVISEGTGEPIADAAVLIQAGRTNPRAFFSASTTRDGAFKPRLAEGTYKVTIRKKGYAPAEASVEVRPGPAGGEVEIRLKPEGP